MYTAPGHQGGSGVPGVGLGGQLAVCLVTKKIVS